MTEDEFVNSVLEVVKNPDDRADVIAYGRLIYEQAIKEGIHLEEARAMLIGVYSNKQQTCYNTCMTNVYTKQFGDKTVTIEDQRDILMRYRPEDVDRFGFVLCIQDGSMKSEVTFATYREAEENILLRALYGYLSQMKTVEME